MSVGCAADAQSRFSPEVPITAWLDSSFAHILYQDSKSRSLCAFISTLVIKAPSSHGVYFEQTQGHFSRLLAYWLLWAALETLTIVSGMWLYLEMGDFKGVIKEDIIVDLIPKNMWRHKKGQLAAGQSGRYQETSDLLGFGLQVSRKVRNRFCRVISTQWSFLGPGKVSDWVTWEKLPNPCRQDKWHGFQAQNQVWSFLLKDD